MNTIDVNARQVGGAHYRSEFQHWDFVAHVLAGRYLEGCITKYVTRWRNKDGMRDLDKALHYAQKLLSQCEIGSSLPLMKPDEDYAATNGLIQKFLDANEITDANEEFVIRVISQWQGAGDIVNVISVIERLIEYAKTQHGAQGRVETVYQTPGFAFEGCSGQDKVHWQCEICQTHVTTQGHPSEGGFDLPTCDHAGTIYEVKPKPVFEPGDEAGELVSKGEEGFLG